MKKVLTLLVSTLALTFVPDLFAQDQATLNLIEAAKTKNYNLVLGSIMSGADVNFKDKEHNTALHYATDIYYTENATDYTGQSQSNVAVNIDNIVNPRNNTSQSDEVLLSETSKIIDLLLGQSDIDVSILNNNGVRAIDNALKSSALVPGLFEETRFDNLISGSNDAKAIADIVALLYKQGPLSRVSKQSLNWLLSLPNVQIDYQFTYDKSTMLHKVAAAGDHEAVSVFKEKGANPHIRNSSWDTPLDLAKKAIVETYDLGQKYSYCITIDVLNEMRENYISPAELKGAEDILLSKDAPLEDGVDETLSLVYRYFLNAERIGDLNKAKVAALYLRLQAGKLSPLQQKKIYEFNTTGISYVETPQSFNIKLFRLLAKYYINTDADLPTNQLAYLVIKKLVNELNASAAADGARVRRIFNKETLDLLYGDSSLASYLKQRARGFTEQSDTRTASYAAMKILNEVTKAFAPKYIAISSKFSLNIGTIDIMVDRERKIDPKLEEICSKVEKGNLDVIKEELKKLEKVL